MRAFAILLLFAANICAASLDGDLLVVGGSDQRAEGWHEAARERLLRAAAATKLAGAIDFRDLSLP